MKVLAWSWKTITLVFALALLTGCATYSGPYYSVSESPSYVGPGGGGYLMPGARDRNYILHIDNRTPFGLYSLPQSMQVLYEKGYDQARRQRQADFALDMMFYAESRDNPDRRAGQALGGAVLGAATGAIIGGALGSPGTGAAIGAGSGGALGLIAPADTPMVRIDIRTQSYTDGTTSFKSALVDLANVPPYDVPRVVDIQVSRMLETLPVR